MTTGARSAFSSVRFRILGPLAALVAVFLVLFAYTGTVIYSSYSQWQRQIDFNSAIHENLMRIEELGGKSREALLLYQLTGKSSHLHAVLEANADRDKLIDEIKPDQEAYPMLARYLREYANGQRKFHDLQKEALTVTMRAGPNENFDGFPRAWEFLEKVNRARLDDLVHHVDVNLGLAESRVRSLLKRMTFAALVILAGGVALVWILARYYDVVLLRPLARLNDGFRSVIDGHIDVKLAPPASGSEIAEMTVNFNRMTEALHESQTELRNFISVAAHDLRSPLATIRGFCEVVSEDLQDGGDIRSARAFVNRIAAISSRSLELMDRLLDLEKAGSAALVLQPCPLSEVLDEALENLQLDIRVSGAQIVADTLPVIQGDRAQLRALFQNIVGNSLKYRSPERTLIVRISALERNTASGPVAEIRFKDNGLGFEGELDERFFKPFARLEPNQKTKGFGVGLSTCRRIVQRHGGRISGRGEPGRGAEFTVVLPVAPAEGRVSIPRSPEAGPISL